MYTQVNRKETLWIVIKILLCFETQSRKQVSNPSQYFVKHLKLKINR